MVDNQSDLVHVQKTGNCLSANVHAVNVLLFSVILHCAARSNILTVNSTGIKIFIGQIFIASFVDFVQYSDSDAKYRQSERVPGDANDSDSHELKTGR